jgi:hypothetical protein
MQFVLNFKILSVAYVCEMGGACSSDGGGQKHVQGFSGET